jgi:hypothetical protein
VHLAVGRKSVNLTAFGLRPLDEGTLFVIMKVMRQYLGDTWFPDSVQPPPDPRADITRLEKMLKAPLRSLAGDSGVAIRPADLPMLNPASSRGAETITF